MRIFVSYRRSDTQDFVGRLADKLRKTRGITDVFLDVEGIGAGEDFVRRIRSALVKSSICLVVIGPDWRGVSGDGKSRILASDDMVRLEVHEALKSEAKILPVLANGAPMPRAEDLPEELGRLTTLNAVSVRHSDFERDTDHLLDVIFARKKPGALGAYFRRHPLFARLLQSIGGAFAALTAMIIALAIINATTHESLDEMIGGPGPASLFSALVILLGAAVPWLLPRRR